MCVGVGLFIYSKDRCWISSLAFLRHRKSPSFTTFNVIPVLYIKVSTCTGNVFDV